MVLGKNMNALEQKKEIIRKELKKLAEKLGKTPTQKDCKKEKQLTCSYHQIIYIYGAWNEALKDANIEPNPLQCPPRNEYSDKKLVDNFIKIANKIGKIPSGSVFSANSTISIRPYTRKFGSWTKAIDYITKNHSSSFNFNVNDSVDSNNKHQKSSCNNSNNLEADCLCERSEAIATSKDLAITLSPTAPRNDRIESNYIQPERVKTNQRNKKTVYGAPLNFRGLRHEPVNEQGVVFLFGMISKELGFIIEAIRTEFPDCEGKRCIDNKKKHWERVNIEFEYRSRNFYEHGHNPDECDVIVCWEHNWPDCPLEVIELKTILPDLPNK